MLDSKQNLQDVEQGIQAELRQLELASGQRVLEVGSEWTKRQRDRDRPQRRDGRHGDRVSI
jgi:hypothetical protein